MRWLTSILLVSAIAVGFTEAHPASETLVARHGKETKSCDKSSFFWSEKNCCLPNGGVKSPPKPPKDTSCPSCTFHRVSCVMILTFPFFFLAWYWSGDKNCCLPKAPNPPSPSCDKDSAWDKGSQCCKVKRSNPSPPSPPKSSPPPTPSKPKDNCDKDSFFWADKGCCLPKGGPPKKPTPPKGHNCAPCEYLHRQSAIS